MGARHSALSSEEIADFANLTFFSKQEVLHCFDRFRGIDPEPVGLNPLTHRHSLQMMHTMPELQFNPFRDRICAVFSTADEEDGSMCFEDFLDMASALSERAPAQLKADWAFRMFDFDADGFIGREDIKYVVARITGAEEDGGSAVQFSDSDLDKIVKNVLAEADLNKSESINRQEFIYIMSKSPDFANNFRMRI